MAYTQADLAAVRAARLRCQRTVQFADRSVTYNSDAELRQLEQDIIRELRQLATTAKPRQSLAVASKGF